MSARGKARKRAVDVLYEADLRGESMLSTLGERIAAADPPVAEYTSDLVEGIAAHRDRIDELISAHAVGWSLDRMSLVDKSILRLGLYELLYVQDVPDAVAISEAVRLTRELSGEEAPHFVNGLLAKVLEEKPTFTK